MDNFTIINLQALTGTVAIILAFKWWVQPRLSNLSIQDALLPFFIPKYISVFGFVVYGKRAIL